MGCGGVHGGDSQTVGLAARRWQGVRVSGRGALTLSHRERPAHRVWMQGGPRGGQVNRV